ncbi:hypothetical protein JEZ13_12405 [bacterium]|nr:hypothetical protein [bacterium]
MCIKKIVVILLLLGISLLSLSSQSAIADENEGDVTIAEMRKAIEEKRISEVNDLLSSSKITEIEQIFSEDEEAYFSLIKENDLTYANFVRGMMFKAYRNVASLQDDLLFIDCKSATYSQEWDKVVLRANDLLRRYPESNRKTVALRYWKLALLKLGKDQEYVNLVEQYPEFELAVQKYQYGQSLYNIGRYDEAQQYLEEAALDNNYTLRASATLALTALAKGNIDEAVSIFDILQKSFSPETPYYDFILLSIARLFSHFGDPDTALSYYQDYSRLNNDDIGEVIYEVAIAYRKAGNLEKAQKSFERILETKFADEYYVQALYNLILIDQELNDGQAATTILTNYQARVDDYFESLLKNRNLISEIRNLRNNFLMETEQSKKEILLEQIKAKEQEVITNQLALEEKISYLDANTIQVIKRLEQEYILRTENYFAELDLIDKYRNTPKDELIAMVNADRINKEFDYILAITEDLLSDIPNPTNNQGERALWYANQLYLKKKYIVNLSKLVDKSKSNPKKNVEFKKLLEEDLENLDEIRVKAKFDLAEFPNLAEKQEIADQQVEEFLAQERKVEEKRKLVIDTYYEKKADKLQRDVVTRFNELDESNQAYSAAFTKFNNIKNEQQNYFNFIELDLEYRKLTESYKQRLAQAERDTVAIPEDEFQQIVNQRENLYNRINTFVFRNNQFENNAKLYFNMAELATIIYPNNHNLIYNNYKKVLELNPDYPQKDVVIYNLAYYENQILDLEIANLREEKMKDINYFNNPRPIEATKTVGKYKKVIDNYINLSKDINSEYQIEAMLRLAKLYYDIAVDADETAKYIGYSIKIFDQIYALGNQEQKNEALFQRAWHKMAIRNYEEALSDLELLMENRDTFDNFQKDKYRATEDIIVYSLDALDSSLEGETNSYSYVEETLFSRFEEETANNIFIKLLSKKRIYDDYENIINLYDARSKVNPLAISNPTYTDSIIVTLSNYGFELGDSLNVKGEREYRKAIERYGYQSEWYEYNKNNDLSPYVKAVQKGLDDFIFPDLYNKVIDNPTLENIEEFAKATQMYADYVGFDEKIRAERLKIYDVNSISTIVKYVRTRQDTIAYSYGINEIYSFIERNPESDIRNNLEQNAYGWAYNITVITDTTAFDSLAYSQQEIEEIKNEKRSNYINSADRYYDYLVNNDLPDKDDIIHRLLFYRGLAKSKLGDKEGAKADFLACNDLNISNEFKEGIYRNLAEIYKNDGDLDTSIEYLTQAQDFADEEMNIEYEREIYNTRAAKINLLNNSGSQEDKIKAAKEMEIVLKSNAIDEEAKNELRKQAIAQYAAGGDFETAITRLIQEGDNSTTVDDAWNNYGSAAEIAADSLNNNNRKIEIEDMFMGRFPNDQQTFAILIQRLAVVQDSTLSTYDPNLASQKMIEIYERATQDGEKLDISLGDLTPEDYYYNAVIFKNLTLSKEAQALEWIAFNKKFPEYQNLTVLNVICQLYEDLGNEEEYLKAIIVLYNADKTSARYPKYAIDKLSAINDKISRAFRQKDWNNMLSLIEEYKQEAEVYTSNGIPPGDIAIPSSLERYTSYTTVYENEQEKKALLADLDKKFNDYMAFVEVSPEANNRIRVNNSIAWNGNMYGEDKLINRFIDLTKEEFASIESDMNLVLSSELLDPEEKRVQLYLLDFAKFKISKYAGDLIFNQINKYMSLPNGQFKQYENLILSRTDITWEEQDEILDNYLFNIQNVQQQFVAEFNTITIPNARQIFAFYINGFTNPLPRSEEVVAFLQEAGVSDVVPTDEKNIDFEPSWRKDFSQINETILNDGHRDFMIYSIPGGETLLLETKITCPILPNAARMRLVEEGDFWPNDKIEFLVKVNDKPINIDDLYLPDGVISDTLSAFPYLNRGLINDDNLASLNYQKGDNTLSISVVNNSFEEVNIGFNYSLIYDKEKLYIHENSVMISVVSDNSWLGADSISTLDVSDPGWGPVKYGNLDIAYDQFDSFKNPIATPIWYGVESLEDNTTTVDIIDNDLTSLDDTLNIASTIDDTLLVTTDSLDVISPDETLITQDVTPEQPTVKYFIKEFEVTGNVIEGILYFVANESANIFLNNVQIGYDEPYYFAPPDAPYIYLEPEDLVQGRNIIIFEVNSPTQTNGLLVDIQIKTISERR